jgi:MipA family protein
MKRAIMLGARLAVVPAPAAADGFQGLFTVGQSVVDRPYAGVDDDYSLAPLVVGRWGNVYFEGSRVMLGLHQGQGWSLAALGQARFHQYHQSADAPVLAGMATRRRTIDLGGVVTVPVGAVTFQAAAMGDVTGAHRGHELELRAFHTRTVGPLTVVPSVSLQRQDERLADYYFGVRPDEADGALERPAYEAGATVNVLAELFAVLALNETWSLAGSFRHYRHGDDIRNSPLVEGRSTNTWALTLGRRF